MSPVSPNRKDPPEKDTKQSSKGALLISPLPLSHLSDPNCPICHEPFCDVPPPGERSLPGKEFAVSIDMVAEWHGSKKLCGHVLGRKCFERHLRSKGAWRNQCPLCRDVWFRGDEPDEEDETDVDPQQDEPTIPFSTTSSPPRRSARVAARTSPGSITSSPRLSVSSGVSRTRSAQQHPTRRRHFTQQLLAALDVRADGDEVTGTMEDVERRLKTLYRNMYR